MYIVYICLSQVLFFDWSVVVRSLTLTQAIACFQSSVSISPHLYQPHYNIAAASEKVEIIHMITLHLNNNTISFLSSLLFTQIGNLNNSYRSVKKSLELFPEHSDSAELMKQLQQHFAAL